MSVGKSSIKRAASAETKKTAVSRQKSVNVKKSVVSPADSEQIQAVFMKEKDSLGRAERNRPVRITEELPEYLL